MISVIICSRGAAFCKEVTQNIAVTIGVPYELVVVDNSANRYGICAAYNEGASRSKYDLLCFAHEDIAFRTPDWGRVVARILADESVGALGVAGGKWLARAPGTWWGCGLPHLRINLLDEDRKQTYSEQTYFNPENQPLVEVAAIDGLWICTRKAVWQQHPFDAQTFPEFHFYDIDFTATIAQHYRVCVTFEVDITHFSRGSYNDSWLLSADRFYRKHASHLPLNVPATDATAARIKEHDLCKEFALQVIRRGLPALLGYQYVMACVKIRPLSRDTFWLVRYYAAYAWQQARRPAAIR